MYDHSIPRFLQLLPCPSGIHCLEGHRQPVYSTLGISLLNLSELHGCDGTRNQRLIHLAKTFPSAAQPFSHRARLRTRRDDGAPYRVALWKMRAPRLHSEDTRDVSSPIVILLGLPHEFVSASLRSSCSHRAMSAVTPTANNPSNHGASDRGCAPDVLHTLSRHCSIIQPNIQSPNILHAIGLHVPDPPFAPLRPPPAHLRRSRAALKLQPPTSRAFQKLYRTYLVATGRCHLELRAHATYAKYVLLFPRRSADTTASTTGRPAGRTKGVFPWSTPSNAARHARKA
ncbi:hypothetical protein C8Q77DRAFT_499653 [Trametes polyzona]|nr:hypothetical protein C8Q77DRAFT_499653 [Trametes polyzona]